MAAAIENNIRGIDAECGGSMSCATCHVYVDAACLQLLPPASQNELELLDGVAASRESNSRLSCQITATDKIDELTVYVPETQS
jgi:2Fe-2S ferredoxin